VRQSVEAGMSVRRYGPADAPPIVYLHGLGEAGTCFERVIAEPALARFAHVVPDLPGYGRSPWPASPASIDATADHLAAWLATFSAPPAVVGHSLGGVLVVLVAERTPLAHAIDVDGNCSLGDCTLSAKVAALALPDLLAGGFDRIRDDVYAAGLSDPAMRGYYAALRQADPHTIHRQATELVALSRTESMPARLAALTCPHAFVAGVPDGICARSHDLLHAAAVQVHRVSPSGHWPFIDQPAAFAATLSALL
jgi:pimeloyl-ACP methyl ester carboxylesterase